MTAWVPIGMALPPIEDPVLRQPAQALLDGGYCLDSPV